VEQDLVDLQAPEAAGRRWRAQRLGREREVRFVGGAQRVRDLGGGAGGLDRSDDPGAGARGERA
jgi:hypothetical protein